MLYWEADIDATRCLTSPARYRHGALLHRAAGNGSGVHLHAGQRQEPAKAWRKHTICERR